MQKQKRSPLLNILCLIDFPVAAWLIMEIICMTIADRHVFKTILDIRNFVRSVGISTCTALALSFNLASGRFDLSLGAQRMAATIVGANIGIALGLSPLGVVACVLICGLISGAIVGVVFVTARVPPMVLGVGMTMVYESVAFVVSKGEGLHLFGKGYEALAQLSFVSVIVILACIFVMFLFQYTRFGYEVRAIQGSQNIAKNAGIPIFKHVALCYTFAGGMASFSGIFDAAFQGSMKASIGMSSNGAVMSCCFPMFLGGFLSRWSNQPVGILVATITLKILNTGFTALNLSATAFEVLNMALFLAFLVVRANENVFAQRKADSARIKLAKAKKEAMLSAQA